MKKTYFLFILTFMCVLFTACQQEVDNPQTTGSIYGIVINGETGEPIQGVSVTLSPLNLTTVTGNDGHYEFVEVEAGQYKIFCQATGFESNYQSVTVKAGLSSTADVRLNPESEISGIRLSTTTLDFGSKYTELALEISNIGTSGNITWSASETADWLKILPTSGTLAMGGTDVITAKVDRSVLSSDDMTFITLSAAGVTKTITVLVEKDGSSSGSTADVPTNLKATATTNGIRITWTGCSNSAFYAVARATDQDDNFDFISDAIEGTSFIDNSPVTGNNYYIVANFYDGENFVTSEDYVTCYWSGSSSGGGSTTTEDYSSASIDMSAINYLDAEIISCKRSGTTVTLTYLLKNSYSNNINISLLHKDTYISDNQYNSYTKYMFTVGSSSSYNYVDPLYDAKIYANQPAKSTIVVQNVDANATKMNYTIHTSYSYTGASMVYSNDFKILNVPIY